MTLVEAQHVHTYFLFVFESHKPPLVESCKNFSHHKNKASSKIKEADWLAVSILSNANPMYQLQE